MEKKDIEGKSKLQIFIKEYLPYILIIILVLLIKKFVVTPIRVNGDSMLKTLHDGDIMILNVVGYKLNDVKRFDIVVVNTGRESIIKRVIGLPGESIEYKNNYGSKKTEDFVYKVPKDSYFVLGDNRTNSMDSRVFGAFKKDKIMGKTSLTILPFDRIGEKR